ncbi:MAG TPA: decaprenyl-phosphate phosphoribosyltransferase [Longimicrobiales bacterium]
MVTTPDPMDVAPAVAPAVPAPPDRPRWPRLRLLRPGQWVKNAFVLAPLIFSGSFLSPTAVLRALGAVALFCTASAATYVLNDLRDREADRRHPVKRFTRPLASGDVSVGEAMSMLGLLCALLLAGSAFSPKAGAVTILYLGINVAYSLRLKHVPVLDLFLIGAGFVLRVLAGAVAISVVLSPWMLITTLCLALYLAVIKRRAELTATPETTARAVLRLYTRPLLDRYAELAAVSAIVFYGMFVTTVRPELVFTVPLVLFGLFRYWYIVERGGGESPADALWGDVPLAVTVLAWGALCTYALWPS